MKPLYLMALLLIVSSCQKTEIKPTLPTITESYAISSPVISKFGRWTGNFSGWGGAYIKTKFTNTVTAKFTDNGLYYFKVDNGKFVKHTGSEVTINDQGIHTLTIEQGKDYHYSFNLSSITGNLSPATEHHKLIEWIGDSITAGYLDSAANISDYAWICSEALGAEHTQIAYPGICLVNGMDKQYFKSTCTGNDNWNFSYKPDVVVINLGTNDQNKKRSDSDFKTAYINFIKQLRQHYGNIPIFLTRPFNGAKWGVIQQVYQSRLNASDTNVMLINTTGWNIPTVDGIHPTDAGQGKAAGKIEIILNPYIN